MNAMPNHNMCEREDSSVCNLFSFSSSFCTLYYVCCNRARTLVPATQHDRAHPARTMHGCDVTERNGTFLGFFWAFGKVLQRLKLPLLKKMYTVQRVMKDHVYSWGCPVNSCTGNSAFYGEKNQKMLGRSTTSGQQDLFAFAERNTRGLR